MFNYLEKKNELKTEGIELREVEEIGHRVKVREVEKIHIGLLN